MSSNLVPFHRACNREMTAYGQHFVRCVPCDTPPLGRSPSDDVELRRVEDEGKSPASDGTSLSLGVPHPASEIWPR